ncbi:rCG54697 [Rattus norvegicus]|uniref:RCG54697 n=1 Tax=Rattus norvegicus TaxID=10116 RepID=A6KFN5_RAT|nr:rCG54697 [Rattus norvegicus]
MLTGGLSEAKVLFTVKDFYLKAMSHQPNHFPIQLREAYNFPLQYSALWKVIQQFTDHVTLDPKTAHPNLLISEARTCVTYTKERQCVPGFSRFTKSPVMLGIPRFNSGRHFWEVQGGKKLEWAVGICKADLSIGERQSPILQDAGRLFGRGTASMSQELIQTLS